MIRTLFVMALGVLIATGCQTAAEDDSASEGHNVSDADHGLELRATPIRSVVPAEGPLPVEITIRNVSDSTARFRPVFHFGGWLDAEITDPSGSRIQKAAEIDPPNAWAVSLPAGELIRDTVDLRCGLPGPPGFPCMAPYDLSRPGGYKVKMRFTLPCDFQDCTQLINVEAEPFAVQVTDAEP